MRGAEVPLLGGKTTNLEFRHGNDVGGIGRGEPDQVRGAVDGHAVQGLYVAAHISATDVVTGRPVRACGHAGQRLDKLYEIRITRRRCQYIQVFLNHHAFAQRLSAQQRRPFDSRRQRIRPHRFLGKDVHG